MATIHLPPNGSQKTHEQLLVEAVGRVPTPLLKPIQRRNSDFMAELEQLTKDGHIPGVDVLQTMVFAGVLIGLVGREMARRQQPHAPKRIRGRYLTSQELDPWRLDHSANDGSVLYVICDTSDLMAKLVESEGLDPDRVVRLPFSQESIERAREHPDPVGSGGSRIVVCGDPCGAVA